MNDLIKEARERCHNTATWPWHSELSLIWKLADALEKAEAELACQKCRASGDTKVCVDKASGYVCPHREAAEAAKEGEK